MTPGTGAVTSDGTSRDAPRPFVGRTVELGLVDRLLADVVAGHGHLLAVTGEPGIGKTRFTEELCDRARAAGMVVAWGTCWTGMEVPPLWPWHELVAALDPARVTPLLETEGVETFVRSRAISDLVREVAGRVPVLLVLDDAHLAEPDAVAMARFVARSARTLPVLVVLTWRTEGAQARPVPDDATEIALHPLAAAEVEALVSALAGSVGGRRLDAQVLALSGGNPLLVSHAVTELASGGVGGPGGSRVLRRRLEVLGDEALEVLVAAAVLGPTASVEEVAAVAGRSLEQVHAAVRRAAERGLVTAGSKVAFTHDLVRTELLSGLEATKLAACHAAAARVLASAGEASAPRLSARAHHALEGAALLPLDEVVQTCRTAAQAMAATGGLGQAEALLGRVLDLYDQPGAGEPPAVLLVEHAEATLSRGRLGEARPRFWRAAAAAERSDDVQALARAALGLGGVWVHEHRSADRLHAYLALLERARERCTYPALRDQLEVRLAGELHYLGRDNRLQLAEAVEAVRAAGAPGPLARTLSILHHTMLGPAFAAERSAVAHEVLANASRAGDALTALMGTMWLAVDAFLAGDPAAPRWHDELRQRAETLDLSALGFVAEAIDVMLLLRAGRFAEAEELAGQCMVTGSAAGDADATGYYGAHLLCSRWMQGLGDELIPAVRDLSRDFPQTATVEVYSAVHAMVAASCGHLDEAATVLDVIRAAGPGDGLAGLPRPTSVAMLTAFARIEAAEAVGDRAMAAEQSQWIAPYAGLPVMGSLAVACFGSAERSLGMAARCRGDLDSATLHLSRAVTACKRLGNLPMVAINLADWAETTTRAGDRTRARALWAEAVEAGDALGLDARVERWTARRDELRAPTAATGRLSRRGEVWEWTVGAVVVSVPHSVGMGYLALLVERAGASVPATELTGAAEDVSIQEVLDPQAIARYRTRIAELEAELAEADRYADIERSSRARAEMDAVFDMLQREVRPDGRSRRFSDAAERSRSAVQKALRRAVTAIGHADASLGEQIGASLTTGLMCRFSPAEGLPTTWSVHH